MNSKHSKRHVKPSICALVFVLMAVLAPLSWAEDVAPGRHLNVLFISIDDLNDWTGFLGGYPGAKPKTPHLDKLAGMSTTFTNALSPSAVCNPARTAVMTGLHPTTSGVYNNTAWFRDFERTAEAVTLAEYFREHGYLTVHAGKIFHGWRRAMTDHERSWDVMSPHGIGTRGPADPNPLGIEFGHPYFDEHFRFGVAPEPAEATEDFKNAEFIADYLRKRHDKPFFLACGIFRPHAPFYAPRRFFDLYPLEDIVLPEVPEDVLADVPPRGRDASDIKTHKTILETPGAWKRYVQAYLASVSFADHCVGHLLEALEEGPNRDNTIVVLWSDHGFHFGEKKHWRKFTLWQEALRCVLLVRPSGETPPARQTGEAVGLIDLYPTLVDFAGLPPKTGLDGHSLVPGLRGETDFRPPVVSTWLPGNHAVTGDRYRLKRYDDGAIELYDLVSDPEERSNLATTDREAYAPVIERLSGHLPANAASPIQNSPPTDAAKSRRAWH